MRGWKKRKDLNPAEAGNLVQYKGFLKKLEVVLDRSIVSNYCYSKDLSKSRLDLNSDKISSITSCEVLQKDNYHGNILEKTTSQFHMKVPGYCNGISEENESLLPKLESVHEANDTLYSNDSHVFDDLLMKQEIADDMIDVENMSDSETNLLNINHVDLTELELEEITHENQLSTKLEITTEPEDTLDLDSYNTNDHSNKSLVREIKLENHVSSIIISDSGKNHKIVQEKQNNSLPVDQNTSKEITTSQNNYYYCNNCSYKTTSKLCINRHIKKNYLTNESDFIPCKKCKKKFRTENILAFHDSICGTKFYFTCKFCPKITSSRHSMKRHIITQHPESFEMSQLGEIMQKILHARERKDISQMAGVLKKISVKNRKIKTNLDRHKIIKMHCSRCNVISDRGRVTIATNCSKCGATLKFQCQMCGKTFSKIGAIRAHIKWSCKNAETKLTSDPCVVSQFERDKNVIVQTIPNDSLIDEQSLSKEICSKVYACKICKIKAMKNVTICKHIEYNRSGCRFRDGFAVCPRCSGKYKPLARFLEHKVLCGIQFNFACTFCPHTAKVFEDIKRHLTSVHEGKYDVKKLDAILAEIRNERNRVKEQYIADLKSTAERVKN